MLSSLVADSEENIIPQITFRPRLRLEYNCPAAVGIQIYLSIYIYMQQTFKGKKVYFGYQASLDTYI